MKYSLLKYYWLIILVVSTGLLLNEAFAASQEQAQWTLWRNNEQLKVSYRNIHRPQLSSKTKLLEIKASAYVTSSISGFLLFIQDIDNISAWLDNADKGQLINQFSENKNQFYIHFAGLWPIKPRLLVLRSHYWQKPDLSVEIKLTDDNSFQSNNIQAPYSDAIRIHIHRAHWRISPQLSIDGQQTLFIEYQFIADAGGKVPQWLANHFALKSIWQTMENITRLLPSSQWQQHTITGIEEITPEPTSP